MSKRTFNRAVVAEESAIVYRGGGQRYFTLKAACRAAARKFLRDLIRAQGEDGLPELMFQREVARMTAELLRGEAMTFDWDEAYERARDDGDPRTPAYGVASGSPSGSGSPPMTGGRGAEPPCSSGSTGDEMTPSPRDEKWKS